MAVRSHSLHTYANTKEEFSIADIVSRRLCTLPAVVKAAGDSVYEIAGQEDLPTDEEILLDRQQNVHFLRVKVLPFHDEAVVRRDKDHEFVTMRNRRVGEEYLLPAHYAGKVKFVARPGGHHRFTSIEQMLESSPRFVRVETSVTSSAFGATAGSVVDAKTILELKKAGAHGDSGHRYLQCQAGNRQLEFDEETPVNMTEVPDPKVYPMPDLRRVTNLLPTCIQMQPVSPDDVSLDNDNEAIELHHILGGPLELISYQTNCLVFAWLKRKGDMSKVAIIPQCIWDEQTVSLPRQNTDISDVLQEPCFKDVQDRRFIKTSLYMIPLSTTRRERLVWLRRNICHDYIDMGNTEGQTNTSNIPPPIPRRIPVANVKPFPVPAAEPDVNTNPTSSPMVPTRSPNSSLKASPTSNIPDTQASYKAEEVLLPIPTKIKDTAVINKLRARAKMGFKKVHEELLKSFKGGFGKKNVKPPSSPHTPSKETPVPGKSPSEGIGYAEPPTVPKKVVTHKLPSTPKKASIPRTLPSALKPGSPSDNNSQSDSPDLDQTKHDDDVSGPEYDYAWSPPNISKGAGDCIETLSDITKISRSGQSPEDFYRYSVNEVYDCFCMCSLNEFAKNCKQQSLDGEFFRHFEIDILKCEPFFLNAVALVKVRRTIDGWRPLRECNTKKT